MLPISLKEGQPVDYQALTDNVLYRFRVGPDAGWNRINTYFGDPAMTAENLTSWYEEVQARIVIPTDSLTNFRLTSLGHALDNTIKHRTGQKLDRPENK